MAELKSFSGELDAPTGVTPFTGALDGEDVKTTAGDVGKSLGQGLAEGVGFPLEFAGNMLAQGINRGARGLGIEDPELRAENPLKGVVDYLEAKKTPGGRRAVELSTPSGDLLDPSTYSLGDDPSVGGYMQNIARVVGQFGVPLGVGAAGKALKVGERALDVAGGVMGAAQAGGAALDQEGSAIRDMSEEKLRSTSPKYLELLAGGMKPATARERIAQDVELASGTIGAVPAALEGTLIQRLLRGKSLMPTVGKTAPARVASAGVSGAVGEGLQEASEQVAQNLGANVGTGGDRDLTEDTFGNALLGAAGGKLAGAGIQALQETRGKGGEGEEPSTAPKGQPEPGKLFPFQSESAAAKRAYNKTEATGEEHAVVPHPEKPERFAVVPKSEVEKYVPKVTEEQLARLHQQGREDIAAMRDFTPLPPEHGDAEDRAERLRVADPSRIVAEVNVARGPKARPLAEPEQAVVRRIASGEFGDVQALTVDDLVNQGVKRGTAISLLDPTQKAMRGLDAKMLVDERAHEAATSPQNDLEEPTDAMKEAGNYQKGHLRMHGLDVSIENPVGSRRRPEWPELKSHYGYIRGSEGADGDHVDAFIGAKPDSEKVFVVDQVDPKTGKFDEHKVMLGFDSLAAASEGYLENYTKGWKGLGAITETDVDSLKTWIKHDTNTKPFGTLPTKGGASDFSIGQTVEFEEGFPPRTRRGKVTGFKKDPVTGADVPLVDTGSGPQPRAEVLDSGRLVKEGADARAVEDQATPAAETRAAEANPGERAQPAAAAARAEEAVQAGGEAQRPAKVKVPRETRLLATKTERAWQHAPKDIKDVVQRVGKSLAYALRKGASWESAETAERGLRTSGAANTAILFLREHLGVAKPGTEVSSPAVEKKSKTVVAKAKQLYVERGGRRFPVDSLEDASRKWSSFRQTSGGGASQIGDGARVVDEDGKEVASISYNGRVWPPGGWKPGAKPLLEADGTPGQVENPAITEANQEGSKAEKPSPPPKKDQESSKPAPADAGAGASKPEKASPPAAQRKRAERTSVEEPAPKKNEDVGENLWYNRRNFTGKALTWDEVKGMNDTLKVKEVVKSKVWPRPDYEQLVEDGLEPFFARMVKQVYDGMKNEPAGKSDADLQRYIHTMTKVRDGVLGFFRDREASLAFMKAVAAQAEARQKGGRVSLISLMPGAGETNLAEVLLKRIWPDEMAKGGGIGAGRRFARGSDAWHDLVAIGGNKAFRAMQFTIDDAVEAMKDLDRGWPAKQEAWQKQGYKVAPSSQAVISEGRQYGSAPGEVKTLYSVATAKGWAGSTIGEYHPTREAAEKAMSELKPFMLLDKRGRLVGQYESMAAAQEGAREATKRSTKAGGEIRGMNISKAEREGPARRGADEDITPDRLMKEFGFRGVNFGREGWINQAERQAYLNHAFDALHDFAEILGVPPKALSLNGMLGLAFGAQGRGGRAAAHFVPGVNEINLTKTMGAGTFAHEWGHAFDHYFGTKAGLGKNTTPYLSAHPSHEHAGVRGEVSRAMQIVHHAMNRRAVSAEEAAQAEKVARERAEKRLDNWLAHIRPSLQASIVATKDFDELAHRLRRGDLGEGYVQSGKQAYHPVIAQIRNLFKEHTGRFLDTDTTQSLSNNAVALRHVLSQKNAADAHIPQTTGTDFQRDSRLADAAKKGDAYWATPHEMFARAFETFIADKLAEHQQLNTFLSDAAIRAEMKTPEGGWAMPYPRGRDRIAIKGAMEDLVGVLKTETTERGVALLSRGGRDQTAAQEAAAKLSRPFRNRINKMDLPVFANEEVLLGNPRLAGTQPIEKGMKRIAYDIIDTPGFKRWRDELGVERAMARAKVGETLLDVKDGKFKALWNIEIYASRRGEGHGRETVASMLLSQDEPVLIRDIQEDAIDFWVKMGAKFPRSADYMEANLDRFQYAAIQRRRGLEAGSETDRANDAQREAGAREDVEGGDGESLDFTKPRESRARERTRGFERLEAPPRAGLLVSDIQRAIAPLRNAWRNAPPIEVVANTSDIPTEVSADAEGAFYRGKVYLVAANLADQAAAQRVLLHETTGHFGLLGVLGDRLEPTMGSIYRTNATVRTLADQWMANNPRKPGQSLEAYHALAAEEALADLAGTGLVREQGFWRWLSTVLRRALRAMGFTIDVNDAEIQRLLGESRRFVQGEKGSEVVGGKLAAAMSQKRPVWYSDLERQLSAVKTESASPDQWKATIKNLKGVKAEEIEWSGVNDWLGTRQGKVTKDEVAQFLEQNGVKVEETVLGGKGSVTNELDRLTVELDAKGYDVETQPSDSPDGGDELVAVRNRRTDTTYDVTPEGRLIEEDPKGYRDSSELPKNVKDLVEKMQALAWREETPAPQDTRYSHYTLPGGQNYRELLLTLPAPTNSRQGRLDAWRKRMFDTHGPGYMGLLSPAERAEFDSFGKEGEQTFRSSHFSQPNILAHVRFDERESVAAGFVVRNTRSGNTSQVFATRAEAEAHPSAKVPNTEIVATTRPVRTLFIEEFQSDWAQKGKREGFKSEMSPEENEQYKEALQQARFIVSRNDYLGFERWQEALGEIVQHADWKDRWSDGLSSGEIAAIDEYRRLRVAKVRNEAGVPAAPFVGKTEAWVALAVKRMIRYAAEHGFERVAYTNGDQQADRYDLSKHVDALTYTPEDDGKWAVTAWKDGRPLDINHRDDGYDAKRLADTFGKDIADKIVRDEGRAPTMRIYDPDGVRKEISGLDLKIGGEGMKQFYDRIVPNVVNDVLKKLGGGKVTEFALATGEARRDIGGIGSNGTDYWVKDRGGETISPKFGSYMEASDWADRAHLGQMKQPGFDITPELAARAMGGMPKFHRAYHGTRHDFDKFDASKIGTGEGAQAYGYGLYFAGRKEVAEHYRKALSTTLQQLKDRTAPYAGYSDAETVTKLRHAARQARLNERNGEAADYEEAARWIEAGRPQKGGGRLFEVELAPKEDEYLDWDKPLAEQSAAAKEALKDLRFGFSIMRHEDATGGDIYRAVSRQLGGDDSASERLAKAGIPGIKYLDASSRLGPTPATIAMYQTVISAHEREIANYQKKIDAEDERFLSRPTTYITNSGERKTSTWREYYQYRIGEMRDKVAEYQKKITAAGQSHYNYVIFDDKHVEIRAKESRGFDLGTVAPELQQKISDMLSTQRKFNWWHRTIGTQYHKASINPEFKRVFDASQRFVQDVSLIATEAADLAPALLPKLESLTQTAKDFIDVKGTRAHQADIQAVAKPVFQGTLKDERVYTDAELKRDFGLSDRQIALYHQNRAAIDRSLDMLAISEMGQLARGYAVVDPGLHETVEKARQAANPTEALGLFRRHLQDLARSQPVAYQKEIGATLNTLEQVVEKVEKLKREGYAPLMRFGQHYVYFYTQAKDGTRETQYFSLHENEREANADYRRMVEHFKADPKVKSDHGLMSQESYRLFKGVSPETLELFADAMGVGEDAGTQAFLRLAVSQRSALKRMIHRKGIEGFSEDVGRTLASFITSNARLASKNYHMGEMKAASDDIRDGDVKDDAVRLVDYLEDPKEEAAKFRGFLFIQYLGGSAAAAMVNATQPVTMSFPYLTQFAKPADVARELKDGAKLALGKGDADEELAAAMKRAAEEGVTEPAEIHQLYAESIRGLGSNIYLRRFFRLWGSAFQLAEQFNRKTTFAAAYEIGRAMSQAELKKAGANSPYDFAEKAVHETQGIYNKANRPNWARGPIGSTVFTFKQFSISYLEFLSRLPRKQQALALAILMLAAGLQGLPFGEDLEDIIDSFAESLGYNFSTEREMHEFIAESLGLGKDAADWVMYGASTLPGMPLDVQARMGLGNLIPGTGMLRKSSGDKSREALEVFGPAGGLIKSGIEAFSALQSGNFGAAAQKVAPVAAQNVAKAADMASQGYYRDDRGRRVVETGPGDALTKAVGFQPSEVAQTQRAVGRTMQGITLARVTEGEIAAQWAEGVFERDPEKVKKARERLMDWNEKNPTTPIAISPGQILRRVREMAMVKAQRIEKTAPKELRGKVAKDLR